MRPTESRGRYLKQELERLGSAHWNHSESILGFEIAGGAEVIEESVNLLPQNSSTQKNVQYGRRKGVKKGGMQISKWTYRSHKGADLRR